MCLLSAPFLSQHNLAKFLGEILKILCVCGKNRLPWILEHRYTAKFFDDPCLQSLVEQSNVIVHVTDYCQHGRRWMMPTGFMCGNIKPQMPREKEECARELDNRQKPTQLFEQGSWPCTFVLLHLLIFVEAAFFDGV